MKSLLGLALLSVLFFSCESQREDSGFFTISKETLQDKIKGAWATQTIGVTYGGPTEFRYNKRIIPDSIEIEWSDTMMLHWMQNIPGLYDDVYMDLTFVEVMEREGIDAPQQSFGEAYANAQYFLWHANQQGRYNILNGIMPPESGHWLNNPHADDIDFQIESDFAGIMNPGMPRSANEICDRVGHIMNSGDGYYGGVFVANMYSQAFIRDDIAAIVQTALQSIPTESTFYQCIADVIQWHRQYPQDWKQTWQEVEDKWGFDLGCPDGVDRDFNIDAKINAAYVVIGLLYGNGDLDRTMEIATRCGQDSDCNPATAGAIVGTVMGYNNIPAKWAAGLPLIEDIDFKYTTTSLNDVYEISYRHALEMIEMNGGEILDAEIRINIQEPEAVPLEQNFTGYHFKEEIPIGEEIYYTSDQEFSIPFTGNGIVLKGKVGNQDFRNTYALLADEQTLNDYVVQVEFYIDDALVKTSSQPLNFITRNYELFFRYELPDGDHVLKLVVLNPHEKVYLSMWSLLVYEKN